MPVVVQDPTWERSFPDVSGVLLPVVDVETGAPRPAAADAAARRGHAVRLHEERYDELVRRFRKAGMDPVTLDDADARAHPPGVPRMGRAATRELLRSTR